MRSTSDHAGGGGVRLARPGGAGDRLSLHENSRNPNIRHSNISSTGSSDHDSRKNLSSTSTDFQSDLSCVMFLVSLLGAQKRLDRRSQTKLLNEI